MQNTNIPESIINKFSNIIILLEDKKRKKMIDNHYFNNKDGGEDENINEDLQNIDSLTKRFKVNKVKENLPPELLE